MASSIRGELIDQLVADARAVWPEDFDGIEEMFNSCCFAMAFAVAALAAAGPSSIDDDTIANISCPGRACRPDGNGRTGA